jgi:hypothetical protein
MLWSEAETALRSHIETQWAAGAHAATQLIWENETYQPDGQTSAFVYISIEGTYSDKGIYGGTGKRSSVEGGIVFFSAFVPMGAGRTQATALVQALTAALELQLVSTAIYLEGGSPPSPADAADVNIPGVQPGGVYYRVSGSVPFIITGAR